VFPFFDATHYSRDGKWVGSDMQKLSCVLAALTLMFGEAASADEFQGVRCNSEIPKAIIGKRTSNGPVTVTEKKYRGLGLKDLGADEVSEQLSSINWLICGSEFILLVDRAGVVRDVLPFPAHSKRSPAFSGLCQRDGRETPDVIIAILDGASTAESLPAKVAWKIDQRHAKFLRVSVAGLVCSRTGIYAIDGGL
jgi:hypothetical protein